MAFTKSSFVGFLLLSYWTLETLQITPDSNDSREESDEVAKETSEKAMNLILLQKTEKHQLGNLTHKLMDQFIEKAGDEIRAIDRAVHDKKKSLVLSGFELLAKRLIGSVTLLDQSKCPKQLGDKMKNFLLQGREYIRKCATVDEVLSSFKVWVQFTFEMLDDLKKRLEMDSQHCHKQKKIYAEKCFLKVFHYNEDRKIMFRKDILQKFIEKADIATDNIEENYFMCTLRCLSAAKKVNTILEKVVKLQLADDDILSDCATFMTLTSTTFNIKPHDSGLEPYFKEIKGISLNGLDDPYQAFMINF